MTATALRADGVHHALDGAPVLHGASLSVDAGEVVAIIGPSGAGKTTLLRLLALFDRPDAGTIAYDGEDVWTLPEDRRLSIRRNLGVVFQESSLFDASVARNVKYGLRVRRPWPERVRSALAGLAGRADASGRVADVLEAVGMADAADRDASSLSGGEAQRVAFARAIAYDPDVLFLDEPTSDLDPRNTAVIEDAIDRARDRGLGVVLATHDMHQARRVADRVGVLLDGGLIEVGPPECVFESPVDERTARFVRGELVYEYGEAATR